jgi:hypothetical protein
MENGRALLRDALSYERPGQLMNARIASPAPLDPNPTDEADPSVPSDLPRTNRAFATPWGNDFLSLSGPIEATTDRNYDPTPEYIPGDAAFSEPTVEAAEPTMTANMAVSAPAQPPLGSASYTRRFAPAYPMTEPITDPATRLRSGPNRVHRHHHHHHHHRRSTRSPNLSAESAAREAQINNIHIDISELPPLRRMGHRSIANHLSSRRSPRPAHPRISTTAPHHRTTHTVDGLGDRQRSRSPTPPSDAWNTLLTTIPPDTHLPSASTSFASGTASASVSLRESTSTSLTTPSSAEPDHPHRESEYPLICDDDDDDDVNNSSSSSDDNNEEEEEGGAHHGVPGADHILIDLASGSPSPSDANSITSSTSSAYGNLSASDRALRRYLMRQIPSPAPEEVSIANAGAYSLAGFPAPGQPPADPDALEAGEGRRSDLAAYRMSLQLEDQRSRQRLDQLTRADGLRAMQSTLRGLVEENAVGDEWFEEVGLVRRERL